MIRSAVARMKPLYLAAGLLIFLMVALGACQSATPTAEPAAPTEAPAEPTAGPTEEPTTEPTAEPTEEPAEEPTAPAEEEPATETMTSTEEITATETVTAAEVTTGTSDSGSLIGDVEAGAYIALLTGGCGCHMNRDLGGLAGGNEFEVPTGVVYASNITPDPETGIGSWSPEAIVNALQTGAEPDGGQLHPAMPYMRFSALSTEEAYNVAAWLLAQEPVSNAVPDGELSAEPASYTPAAAPLATPPTDPIARGEQLVVLAACGGCHTPKDADGSDTADMLLAGAPLRDEFASNLTPDEATGIGSWSEAEIAHFLVSGMYPDGSMVEGAMGQQITRRFSQLTEGDATAIATYLKSIPGVSNAAP
ncbi:MAG: c-type cytochrome [Caldilineaceae bacterium]|nr:c-type cytochrome [Caldilineaceae bacterium]